jgi:hypothetical protein
MIAVIPCEEHVNCRAQISASAPAPSVALAQTKGINVNSTDDPSSRRGAVENGPVNAGGCPTYLGVF